MDSGELEVFCVNAEFVVTEIFAGNFWRASLSAREGSVEFSTMPSLNKSVSVYLSTQSPTPKYQIIVISGFNDMHQRRPHRFATLGTELFLMVETGI
jgi:hypothetical protein